IKVSNQLEGLYETRNAINEIDFLKQTLGSHKDNIQQLQEELQALKTDVTGHEEINQNIRTERMALLGETDPDDREAELRASLDTAIQKLHTHQQQLRASESQFQQLQQSIATLKQSLLARAEQLTQDEDKFTVALAQQQFA